jgi:hypothetical protein
MKEAYCHITRATATHSFALSTPHAVYGGGGGGGPSTGTVIGGRPGIITTVEPTGAGPAFGSFGSSGGAPGGGGGSGGAIPLLIWMVMIEPGTVWPAGEVPTTAPAGEELLTGVA